MACVQRVVLLRVLQRVDEGPSLSVARQIAAPTLKLWNARARKATNVLVVASEASVASSRLLGIPQLGILASRPRQTRANRRAHVPNSMHDKRTTTVIHGDDAASADDDVAQR